jgi:Uncharacterized protein related to glutamine synthetase
VTKIGDGLDRLAKTDDALSAALHGKPEAIIAALRDMRAVIDELELIIDDDLWPLPKYREMLFVY